MSMVKQITGHIAKQMIWQPMLLVHINDGCWCVLPATTVADDAQHIKIKVGIDASLFGRPLCGNLYECIVCEHGVLALFAVVGDDADIASMTKGKVQAKWMSDSKSAMYYLPYRLRQV